MNRRKPFQYILLLAIISLFHFFGHTQEFKDGLVSDIQKAIYQIRSNTNWDDTVIVETWDESADGGIISYYFTHKRLKLMTVELFGEYGKWEANFFIRNNVLISVYETVTNYNSSIYFTDEKAIEYKTDPYTPEKAERTENQYYFHNLQLIKIIPQLKETSERSEKEEQLLITFNYFLNKLHSTGE